VSILARFDRPIVSPTVGPLSNYYQTIHKYSFTHELDSLNMTEGVLNISRLPKIKSIHNI